MAIELHLKKSSKIPWGFRLAGGVEFEVPLTVIKVTEGSIAENAGIRVGDVVVRLNDIPMTGLTHPQAHDALLVAGNDFTLVVQRGDLSHLPPRLLLYETSVENAEDTINVDENEPEENKNAVEDLNITDEEIVNIIGDQVQVSAQKTSEENDIKASEGTNIRKVSEVAKVILSEETQKTVEKKWSTFLQKPKNPKPKPKVKEVEGPKVTPYKVIIKKQPKKGQEVPREFIINKEEKSESEIEISSKSEENTVEDFQDNDQNQEFNESEGNMNSEEEEESNNNNEDVSESSEINKEQEEEVEDTKDESHINKGFCITEKRLSINLEEQLVQVQQQLAALAQLPSAIQQTLNAVTQQLSEIVAAKQIQEQEIAIEAKTSVQEEFTAEYLDVSEEHEEKALSVLEEESYEHYEQEITEEEVRDEALESTRNESEDEQALFEALETQIEEEERRKVEELEARRLEQEKIQKRDKERRPSQPLTPLQRPIILPGGRKWSQPIDAVSKIRHPSITDEKIANTINTFSEVIVGRTVGINFLKYQPPPKNLEYLQKSAVYRLVHDIEPPPKGIIARNAKILAEQDYYSEEQEHKNMQAQMER